MRSRSRRSFLKSSAAAAVGASFPTIIPATALGRGKRPAPSERVTMAFIGTGNQGMNEMKTFLSDERVQVIAVCDVNKESPGYWENAIGGRGPAKRLAEDYYSKEENVPRGGYRGCATYEDYRELLARDDLDAVEIATPDHWHVLQVLDAARAGKHIYGQKPLALTIPEGRLMSDAVRKAGITWQTGSQRRSDQHNRLACEYVRNGRIGKVHTVKVGLVPGNPDINRQGHRTLPEPVPEGLNYELWLGPAPHAPYCGARLPVNWRWILDYSGGNVTDIGAHNIDIAQWGLGTDGTGPVEIRNARATFPPEGELWNTATSYYFEAIYKNGVKMIVADSHQVRSGITFEGEEGRSIWCDSGQFETHPKELREETIGENERRLYNSRHHFRNFIDCVYSGQPTAAPIEAAHRTVTIAHLGNIAMRLKREKLRWDPDNERILEDAEAARMLNRPMRAPWKLGTERLESSS
ncbi:MAG: Gfo/Idh/MocA family oxidoreductase [Verrucomicrobiota bacterium]